MRSTTEAFWAFSLELFSRPGVEAACLTLQDDFGANVNIVLWSCWLPLAGYLPPGPEEISQAVGAVAGWQRDVVVPIRQVRRNLKRDFSAHAEESLVSLRKRLQGAELQAERLEQALILRAAAPRVASSGKGAAGLCGASAALEAYLRCLAAADRCAARAATARILDALAEEPPDPTCRPG